MPASPTQLAILEEAVRLADVSGDVALGVRARYPLMWCARNLLRGELLAVTFTWSLNQYDLRPDLFDGRNLLAEYSMVIGQLANQHAIARATLERMLDDYTRRLHDAGRSPTETLLARLAIAPDLGDRELARATVADLARWPGALSRTDRIEMALFVGDTDDALAQAAPFISGSSAVSDLNHDLLCCKLLLPLWDRGRVAEMDAIARRVRRNFFPERCYYWPYGDLVAAMALLERTPEAARMYVRCQAAIGDFTDPLTRLHFAIDQQTALSAIETAGQAWLAISSTQENASIADQRKRLHEQASELATSFDARNGNSYFTNRLHERLGAFNGR